MKGEDFFTTHARLIQRLHEKALAGVPVLQGQLSEPRFAQTLHRSVEHRFRDANPQAKEIAAYLESLHVEDLALACACAEGHDAAWEHFIIQFRPILYAAGRAITGDEVSGRELADSIYAELYGVQKHEGPEKSGKGRAALFQYFHGRSKLSTWLRAVLAQRHVDAVRAGRRTDPLADEEVAQVAPADPDRARYVALLQTALTAALGCLQPRDRLRLSCYYVQDMTLAQIGRLLGEHEATVSRKLDRARRHLRTQVERSLAAEKRLSAAEIRLCYEYAMEEWPFDLTGALTPRE